MRLVTLYIHIYRDRYIIHTHTVTDTNRYRNRVDIELTMIPKDNLQ